jgi:hypothetical protein
MLGAGASAGQLLQQQINPGLQQPDVAKPLVQPGQLQAPADLQAPQTFQQPQPLQAPGQLQQPGQLQRPTTMSKGFGFRGPRGMTRR